MPRASQGRLWTACRREPDIHPGGAGAFLRLFQRDGKLCRKAGLLQNLLLEGAGQLPLGLPQDRVPGRAKVFRLHSGQGKAGRAGPDAGQGMEKGY